jgi:Mn-dependent DtxR family transcriptional regulator
MDNLVTGYGLTPLQAEYLRFIIEYAQDHNGNSPSKSEIANQFNVGWSTARWHVAALSNKRLVQEVDSKIVVEDAVWEPPYNIIL